VRSSIQGGSFVASQPRRAAFVFLREYAREFRQIFMSAPPKTCSAVFGSPSENFGTDGKDFDGEMLSPQARIYYDGEIGFLYGHSIGNGSGDILQTYIQGTVGNDHFQITARAAYEEWSGHTPRFRSFPVSR